MRTAGGCRRRRRLVRRPSRVSSSIGSARICSTPTIIASPTRCAAWWTHAPAPVRWFIVDAGAITDLDYSAARSVRDLLDDLARQNVGVIFARVSPYLRSDMDRHGVTAAIGDSADLHDAARSHRRGARRRARSSWRGALRCARLRSAVSKKLTASLTSRGHGSSALGISLLCCALVNATAHPRNARVLTFGAAPQAPQSL